MPDEDSDNEFVFRPLNKSLPTVKEQCVENVLSKEPQTLGLQTNLTQLDTHCTRLNLDGDQEPLKSFEVSSIPEDKSTVKLGESTIKCKKSKRTEAKAGEHIWLELPYDTPEWDVCFGDMDWSVIKPTLNKTLLCNTNETTTEVRREKRTKQKKHKGIETKAVGLELALPYDWPVIMLSLKNPSMENTDSTRIPHENKREVPSPEDTSVTESTIVQVCLVTKKSTVHPEPKEQSGSSNNASKLQQTKCSATKAGDCFWSEMPDEDSNDEFVFRPLNDKSSLPTVKEQCVENVLSEEPQTLGLQTNLTPLDTHCTRLNLDGDQEPLKSSEVSSIPEDKGTVKLQEESTIKRKKSMRKAAKAGEHIWLELPYDNPEEDVCFGDVDWSVIKPTLNKTLLGNTNETTTEVRRVRRTKQKKHKSIETKAVGFGLELPYDWPIMLSLRNPSMENTDSTRIPHENKREVSSPKDTSVIESTSVQVCLVTKKSTVHPEPKEKSGSSNNASKLQQTKHSATKAGDCFWSEMPDEDSNDEFVFRPLNDKSSLLTVNEQCVENGLSEEPQTLGLQTNLTQLDTHCTRLNLDGDQEPLKSSEVSSISEDKSTVKLPEESTIKRKKSMRKATKVGEHVWLELPYDTPKVDVCFGDVDWSVIEPTLNKTLLGNTNVFQQK